MGCMIGRESEVEMRALILMALLAGCSGAVMAWSSYYPGHAADDFWRDPAEAQRHLWPKAGVHIEDLDEFRPGTPTQFSISRNCNLDGLVE